MSNCPQCGAPLGDGAKFCSYCGAQISVSDSNYSNQNNYRDQSNYSNQYNYGNQNNYSSQNNYGSQSGYGSQSDYRNQNNYGSQGAAPDLVSRITGRLRTCATIWLVIGIIQICVGLPLICVGYGILPVALGIWNIVQSNKKKNLAIYFNQNPVGIVNYFDNEGTMLIVFLIINLFAGAIIGVVASIYELIVRNDALSYRRELLDIEASFQYGGY